MCRAHGDRVKVAQIELAEQRKQSAQLKTTVSRLQAELSLKEKQLADVFESARSSKGEGFGDTYEEVLREEMMMMKAGFELKLKLLQEQVSVCVCYEAGYLLFC